MNVAQETLGFRRGSLSLPLSLLMSAFALLISPAFLTEHLHRLTERSPTMHINMHPSFGYMLSPVTSSARDDSTSELLRFL